MAGDLAKLVKRPCHVHFLNNALGTHIIRQSNPRTKRKRNIVDSVKGQFMLDTYSLPQLKHNDAFV